MNHRLELSKKKNYILATLFLLVTFFVVHKSFAQMSDEQIAEAINTQQTGRLPGAWLDRGTGNRNNFELHIKFDMFEPQGKTVVKEIEIPGPLMVPTCFTDLGGALGIQYHAESPCPEGSTAITEFYTEDPDADPIRADQVVIGSPRLTLGTEDGEELRFDHDSNAATPNVPLYVTKGGMEVYPQNSEIIYDISDPGTGPEDVTVIESFYLETVTDPGGFEWKGCDWEGGTYPVEYFRGYNVDYDCYKDYDIQAIKTACAGPSAVAPNPSGDGIDYDCVFDTLEDVYYEGDATLCPSDENVDPILPGGVRMYPLAAGQPIFTETCEPQTQCVEDPPGSNLAMMSGVTDTRPGSPTNGEEMPELVPVFAGDVVNRYDNTVTPNTCTPTRKSLIDPVIYVRGGNITRSFSLPLFFQRFYNDYDPSLVTDVVDDRAIYAGSPIDIVVGTGTDGAQPPITNLNSAGYPYSSLGLSFEATFEGDYMCAYAYSSTRDVTWRIMTPQLEEDGVTVKDEGYPDFMYEVLDKIPVIGQGSEDVGSAYSDNRGIGHRHCIKAPYVPVPETALDFSEVISPICSGYSVLMPDRDVDWSTSYAGVEPVVISNWPRPFTGVVVECIHDTMTNIFISDPNETEDYTFFRSIQDNFYGLVRLLLILYVIFFGYRLVISRNPPGRSEIIVFVMRVSIIIFFTIGDGVPWLFGDFTQISRTLSAEVMEAGLEGNVNDGYSLCDFRAVTYPDGRGYMALWDTIDCKLSKYLGIGDNWIDNGSVDGTKDANDTRTMNPQVLWVAATAVISQSFGIPIFIIAVIVTLFIIMVVIRAVHIYILAFIGLCMLVFISPLIIPAALFEFTRYIFGRWLQQVMSYLVQPIILFGFLSFSFLVIDVVYFGDNDEFVPLEGESIPFQIASNGGGGLYGEAAKLDDCKDPDAIGCILQTSRMYTHDIKFISKWTDIVVYKVDMGGQDLTLFIGLLQLLLICVIVKALLGTVEKLASNLTGGDIIGGSASPVVGPSAMMGATSAITNRGVRSITTGFAGVGRAFERLGASRRMRAGTGGLSLAEMDQAKRAASGTLRDGGTLLDKDMSENLVKNQAKNEKSMKERFAYDPSKTSLSMVEEIGEMDRARQAADTKEANKGGPIRQGGAADPTQHEHGVKEGKAHTDNLKVHTDSIKTTVVDEDNRTQEFRKKKLGGGIDQKQMTEHDHRGEKQAKEAKEAKSHKAVEYGQTKNDAARQIRKSAESTQREYKVIDKEEKKAEFGKGSIMKERESGMFQSGKAPETVKEHKMLNRKKGNMKENKVMTGKKKGNMKEHKHESGKKRPPEKPVKKK